MKRGGYYEIFCFFVNIGDRLKNARGDAADVVFKPSAHGLSAFRYVVNGGQTDLAVATCSLDVVSGVVD